MRKLSTWRIVGLLVLSSASIEPASAENVQLFATEIQAQKHCPADIVVWVDTSTDIYHFKGMRWYGNTKSGAYVCQKEADRAGYRLPIFCRYCSGPRG